MLIELKRIGREDYLRNRKEALNSLKSVQENGDLNFKENLDVLQYGLDYNEFQIFYDEDTQDIYVYDNINHEMTADIDTLIDSIYEMLDYEEE